MQRRKKRVKILKCVRVYECTSVRMLALEKILKLTKIKKQKNKKFLTCLIYHFIQIDLLITTMVCVEQKTEDFTLFFFIFYDAIY